MKGVITRTILVLSLVSLFTDIASEMLYPVMPIFLKSIGFSVLFIGILEGIAEAIAGFGKGYFGKLSDASGKRLPFVRLGYSLSAISKPMMALIIHPLWILLGRTLDRVGKGVRTGARDAILSAETTPGFKGQVFGFHRAFDTVGAALGPSIALVFLYFYPGRYIPLFYIAFIPGVLAIALTFLMKEQKNIEPSADKSKGFFSFLKYWKPSPTEYKRLVAGLLVFTLVNSSDVFLLLMAKHRGLPDSMVIIVYIFYNMVYAVFSEPVGRLGDKIGLKYMLIAGLVFFTFVYTGMAFAATTPVFFILFFLYGIYASATEGISKAWITNIVRENEAATAIGFYTGFQSICTLVASVAAGFLWSAVSPKAPFLLAASATAGVVVYMVVGVKYKKQN